MTKIFKLSTITVSAASQLAKVDASKYSLTSRSMCSYVARCAGREREWPASLVNIDVVGENSPDAGKVLLDQVDGICISRIAGCLQSSISSSGDDEHRSEEILTWIMAGFGQLRDQGVVSDVQLEKILSAVNDARHSRYMNRYEISKPVHSPDRRRKAVIEIQHGVRECVGRLLIKAKDGQVVWEETLFREDPHEIYFQSWIVRPKWVTSQRVSILRKRATEPMHFDIDAAEAS